MLSTQRSSNIRISGESRKYLYFQRYICVINKLPALPIRERISLFIRSRISRLPSGITWDHSVHGSRPRTRIANVVAVFQRARISSNVPACSLVLVCYLTRVAIPEKREISRCIPNNRRESLLLGRYFFAPATLFALMLVQREKIASSDLRMYLFLSRLLHY